MDERRRHRAVNGAEPGVKVGQLHLDGFPDALAGQPDGQSRGVEPQAAARGALAVNQILSVGIVLRRQFVLGIVDVETLEAAGNPYPRLGVSPGPMLLDDRDALGEQQLLQLGGGEFVSGRETSNRSTPTSSRQFQPPTR